MQSENSIGKRIRFYREKLHWSQMQLARKVALSQKQLSRIEQSQVLEISRDLLIVIAKILKEPIVSGELNQWLYHSGYRPYILPLMELPDGYVQWVKRFDPFPAALLDIGWYLRYWNSSMASLFEVPYGSLRELEQNLVTQLYAPDAPLQKYWTEELKRDMMDRLLTQWRPFASETWHAELLERLSRRIGRPWQDLAAEYGSEADDIVSTSEFLSFQSSNIPEELHFRSNLVPIPNRPDLLITLYYPLDKLTEQWCEHVSGVATSKERETL